MPSYLWGVVVAFFEPVLHAWSNVVDNYFSNAVFPRLSVLLFFGTLLNVLFLPLTFFAGFPVLLSFPVLVILFVIGVINVAYAFPYYWALRHADTSVVASLFALGRIFVPVFAFFIVGELLTLPQYAGFLLIILASVLLTFDFRKLHLNRALFLMLSCSLMLSFQTVLYKYVFEAGASWPSVVAALTVFEIVIAGAIMLSTASFAAIAADFQVIRKNLKLFFLQQGLEWSGNMSGSYAVSVLPVTVAQAIVSTQPFFVLLYALVFGRRFPHLFKELTGRGDMLKKGLLFILIIIGTVLVVMNGVSSLES